LILENNRVFRNSKYPVVVYNIFNYRTSKRSTAKVNIVAPPTVTGMGGANISTSGMGVF
jgi:hypothetical protein